MEGTKDFSGTWINSGSWVTDGTYKGLTVKKRTSQWSGIYKVFTAPKDGYYTFSDYVKSSGDNANVTRYVYVNDSNIYNIIPNKLIGNNIDWLRDSLTVTLKANDKVYIKYEITSSGTGSILWTAGHKWEEGSIATPWSPSSNPSYIGKYVGEKGSTQSTNPTDYDWFKL